jgi:hypothetical protein
MSLNKHWDKESYWGIQADLFICLFICLFNWHLFNLIVSDLEYR